MPSAKKIFFPVASTVVISGTLAAAGFWDPASQHYWRAHTQSLLLRAAVGLETSIPGAALHLITAGLSVHPIGITVDEMASAATLFGNLGKNSEAAKLWMGVANASAASDRDRALVALEHAATLGWGEQAIASAIILLQSSPGDQASWVNRMQYGYPGHELSIAFTCIQAMKSLDSDPPPLCLKLQWIAERAWHARNEDLRLAREIEELPQKTAQEIAVREASIREQLAGIPEIEQRLQEMTKEKSNLGWTAAGEVLLDRIPFIPRRGDTLESYAVREVGCLAKWINPFCIAGSIINAVDKVSKNGAAIDAEVKRLAEWRALKLSLVEGYRRGIEYWQSDVPYRSLVSERSVLLGRFEAGVKSIVYERHSTIGIPPQVALRDILSRGASSPKAV